MLGTRGELRLGKPVRLITLAAVAESEDCRAVALAKADSLSLPHQRSELRLGVPLAKVRESETASPARETRALPRKMRAIRGPRNGNRQVLSPGLA